MATGKKTTGRWSAGGAPPAGGSPPLWEREQAPALHRAVRRLRGCRGERAYACPSFDEARPRLRSDAKRRRAAPHLRGLRPLRKRGPVALGSARAARRDLSATSPAVAQPRRLECGGSPPLWEREQAPALHRAGLSPAVRRPRRRVRAGKIETPHAESCRAAAAQPRRLRYRLECGRCAACGRLAAALGAGGRRDACPTIGSAAVSAALPHSIGQASRGGGAP